ncbi:FxDxF family PEP-CTERM protein [Ferribacterium limneticum]|uniref:FxDxF family PEP-CTERM protein n=1 Tax=Ferribacterium limneticum TaxID=76259 RepID=UPI001CF8B381|nr:FxDxF family PEP-CTERM protein [Ferribacterium limneticum]UCV21366.1 PEP-CTERM sorting domain-containing protein [Ferribacterium limneticum]
MKTNLLKPLLASLLIIGCASAQAAHFEVQSYTASSLYSGMVNFEVFKYDGADLSGGGDVLTMASGIDAATDYTHAGSAFGSFYNGQTLDLSTSVSFDSANAINYFGMAVAVEKNIQLKVVADSGDVGPVVNVSFAGLSSTVNNLAGATGSFQTTVRVMNGSSLLGSFNTTQYADQNISFAFTAQAGDILTLSASQGSTMNATGPINASLTGMLSGDFTVTAVPEPEQYAMLLAGLGLIAGVARRRSSR